MGGTGDIIQNLCSSAADALGGQIPGFDEGNQVLGDVGHLYELMRRLLGLPMPEPTSLGGAACRAALGGG